MNQTLTTKFQNKTSIEKNSGYEKTQFFFIPKNTTVFTKEMTKKIEIEEEEIQKELERYTGWINQSRFYFAGIWHKINEGLKKIRIKSKNYKITQSIIFNRWSL